MELVVHDSALRNPTQNARGERLPHVHAGRRDPAPLHTAQFRPEELVQRFPLAALAKPQRFARLQIAYHGQELLRLPQVDLVHPHLPQHRPLPALGPSLQIALVDSTHSSRSHPELARHLPCRRRLARQPHGVLEVLAERRLTGKLRNCLDLQSALRAVHSVELDHHKSLILAPRQVAHLALPDLALRANIAETLLVPLITEQGGNGIQHEEHEDILSGPVGRVQ